MLVKGFFHGQQKWWYGYIPTYSNYMGYWETAVIRAIGSGSTSEGISWLPGNPAGWTSLCFIIVVGTSLVATRHDQAGCGGCGGFSWHHFLSFLGFSWHSQENSPWTPGIWTIINHKLDWNQACYPVVYSWLDSVPTNGTALQPWHTMAWNFKQRLFRPTACCAPQRPVTSSDDKTRGW